MVYHRHLLLLSARIGYFFIMADPAPEHDAAAAGAPSEQHVGKKRRLETSEEPETQSPDEFRNRVKAMVQHMPKEAIIDILAEL